MEKNGDGDDENVDVVQTLGKRNEKRVMGYYVDSSVISGQIIG